MQTGDVIEACGGQTVTSTEQFQSLLQKNGTETMELSVKRQGNPVTLSVEPERNEEGVCCIGAWVRDSMAGIGTVTYYDPDTNTFGALGHGITDGDTAALMPFGNGSILPSTVKAVRKGTCGSAGELRGNFDLTEELGQLYANTSCRHFRHGGRRLCPGGRGGSPAGGTACGGTGGDPKQYFRRRGQGVWPLRS